jgi:hypothetical protein
MLCVPSLQARNSRIALATGGAPGPPQAVAARLGQVGTRVIVALDTYEAFRLMDSWLRQVLIPLLLDNVRLILCGREGPVTAWLSAPGWHGLLKAVRLDSLDQRSALELLSRAGVPPEEAKRLQGYVMGTHSPSLWRRRSTVVTGPAP